MMLWQRPSPKAPPEVAGALFDHLVGLREQLCRHVEAKHLRSLEIDDEFEFRGLLNGKVRRLCAFQDFIYELCCATIELSPIYSVRHQSTCFRKISTAENGWQPSLCCEIGDLLANTQHQHPIPRLKRAAGSGAGWPALSSLGFSSMENGVSVRSDQAASLSVASSTNLRALESTNCFSNSLIMPALWRQSAFMSIRAADAASLIGKINSMSHARCMA